MLSFAISNISLEPDELLKNRCALDSVLTLKYRAAGTQPVIAPKKLRSSDDAGVAAGQASVYIRVLHFSPALTVTSSRDQRCMQCSPSAEFPIYAVSKVECDRKRAMPSRQNRPLRTSGRGPSSPCAVSLVLEMVGPIASARGSRKPVGFWGRNGSIRYGKCLPITIRIPSPHHDQGICDIFKLSIGTPRRC